MKRTKMHREPGTTTISHGYYNVRIESSPALRRPHVDPTSLANLLPHGSGIDADWHIQVTNHGDLRVRSSFHHMNENGMYDGWYEFSFRVFKHKTSHYHKLHGNLTGKVQVIHKRGDIDITPVVMTTQRYFKEGHEEYLTDTIYHALETLVPPLYSKLTLSMDELPAYLVKGDRCD